MAVYKRNNIWYIDYYLTVNGKRERRREPVSTRKDVAEALLKEYRDKIKDGIDPEKTQTDISSVDLHENTGNSKKSQQELTLERFKPIFLELHGINQSEKMQESYRTSLGHLIKRIPWSSTPGLKYT